MSIQVLSHREQWFRAKIGPTVTVAYTGLSSSNVGPLQPGRYRVYLTTSTGGAAAHLRQGASGISATTSDRRLQGGLSTEMTVDGQEHSNGTDSWNDASENGDDRYLHVIGDTGITGTLYVTKISDLQAAT